VHICYFPQPPLVPTRNPKCAHSNNGHSQQVKSDVTATAEKEYGELLSRRRPRAITTKRAYDSAKREIEALTVRAERRSAAETEYYRVLCALAEDYERRAGADRWQKLEPLGALRELMELKSVSQAQVADALGDRAAASSILSGRRQISKALARKLAALFSVDAGIFI
jgi:HTH-type transcriptional regulator / antitoxin HigA